MFECGLWYGDKEYVTDSIRTSYFSTGIKLGTDDFEKVSIFISDVLRRRIINGLLKIKIGSSEENFPIVSVQGHQDRE